MKFNRPIFCVLLLSSFALYQPATAQNSEKPLFESEANEFFLQKVHPLLEAKCFGCHGEDSKNIEGDLDMRTREGLVKGGESGKPAVVPGKPEESPMFRAVLRREKMKMPPKDRNALSTEET